MQRRLLFVLCLFLSAYTHAKELKLGLIGLDTSHVVASTKILNDEKAKGHVSGGKVIAAFKGGSDDIQSELRADRSVYEDTCRRLWSEALPDHSELCQHVDAILLESVDGRPHLEQEKSYLRASLSSLISLWLVPSRTRLKFTQLAAKHKVPVFSSSSLRWGRNSQTVRNGSIGKVTYCETHSPCSIEPTHPDLFWYGIHGVESLFTVMGTGCQSVQRSQTPDGRIKVQGTWSGGRIGIFREGKGYGGKARGTKGEAAVGSYDGYAPMVADIVKFFKTGKPPVSARETLEIYAFMIAADESKRHQGGKLVASQKFLKSIRS